MTYVEILIAAVAAFLLGWLWYTALFGKLWQQESGITDEQAKSNIGLTHGLAFLAMAFLAYVMQSRFGKHWDEDPTFKHGAYHAYWYVSRFALPILLIHYLYQKKSIKLFLIDGLFAVAFAALMGGIMSLLQL